MPGGYVCSGSFKGKTTGKEVRDVIGGTLSFRKLFSKKQRLFYAEHARKASARSTSFRSVRPSSSRERSRRRSWVARFAAEYWLYQDGSRILELSTKCLPKEAFQVAAEARAFLVVKGISLSGSQQTKTRTALEFFQKQLAAAAKPAPRAARRAAPKPAARRAAPKTARRAAPSQRRREGRPSPPEPRPPGKLSRAPGPPQATLRPPETHYRRPGTPRPPRTPGGSIRR